MCKVSVIVPMYNVEPYLRECLDSIVNQTLTDIEVICVDDGSRDRTAAIAAEYVEKHKNFQLIQKENGGQSTARNVGLRVAKGEYVYFLDSDDYIDPETLEELCAKADPEELDIVFFNTKSFFENETIKRANPNYVDYYSRKNDYPEVYSGQTMFAKMRQNKEFFGSPCLEMFRRSLIEDNQLRFYEGIIHEDNLFTFQSVMLAKRAGYIAKAYYNRRVHDDSTMTKPKSMRNVEGYIVSYSEALAFMRNVKIEQDAEQTISEYLYYSLYRNACNIWNGLASSEKERPLTHGGFSAEHLFSLAKRNMALENQLNALKKENDKLRTQTTAEQSFLLRCLLWIPRNVKGFFLCAKESGYRYAIRRAFGKVCNLLRKVPMFVRKLRVKMHMKSGGKTPLVSFILPVYNVEEFLAQGMDTLIQQTLPHIEIIAVDDGSTDRSLEILKQYAEKDSRVKVFTQKNQYAGAARNLGLSKATGEYVVFLDSDDFFAKGLAKDAYFEAKIHNADIVLFGAKHFNNSTKKYREAKWLFKAHMAPEKQPFSYKDCANTLYQITTPCPWTKMFRREFILSTGLQFQTLRNSNDVFFTCSAMAMAKRIVTLDRVLVYYRVGLENNLQTTKKKNPLCFYEAYKALHDKLQEIGALDELRQSYVNLTLSGCLYNLRTVGDPEARQLVYDALKNEAFDTLELAGYESAYYYDRKNHEELCEIIDRAYDYKYFSELSKPFYAQALKKWYFQKTGKPLNLENPVTYNDKLNWIKLNEHNELKTQYSDKYLVRKYVADTIGEQYLVPLIGVWSNAEDIDFDTLPDQFVLKAAHGSGWNIIVTKKSELDIPAAVKRLNWWLSRKLSFCNGLELHYNGIEPRIIAEQYLENSNENLDDYKVWCFNGKAHFIQYLTDRKRGLKMAFYDPAWNKLPFVSNHEQYENSIEKPDNLDQLINFAEALAKPFNHVRVDFYRLNNGQWKFGEMTFTPNGGRCLWNPPEYDEIIGELFLISESPNT